MFPNHRKGLHRNSGTEQARAKARLDRAFSAMIRARDAGLPCIACGNPHKEYDAGHYRRREEMSVRFDYRNVNAEGPSCNRGTHNNKYGMKDMDLYRHNLDARWGKGTADALFKRSRQLWNWDVKDLDALTDAAKMSFAVYRQLYDELARKYAQVTRPSAAAGRL